MSSANDIWRKKKRGKFEKEIAPGFKSCWPKADDSHGLEVQTLDLGKANMQSARQYTEYTQHITQYTQYTHKTHNIQ